MRIKNVVRWVVAIVVVVFVAGVAEASLSVTRDDKGVWFITGDESDSIYDVFEAMGYAVATDRLFQAETYRRMAKGELAEIYGPALLGQDMLARITGYSAEELAQGYETLDPEVKEMIGGYVAGFNRRINDTAEDPSQLPFEFHALAQQLGTNIFIPEPWTGEDVLAWQAALLRQFDPEALKQGQIGNAALLRFLTDTYGPQQGMEMFDDLRWHNDPDATTYIPDSAVTSALPQQIRAARVSGTLGDLHGTARTMERLWKDRETQLRKVGGFPEMGSYAWVLSGDKTASGRATLYAGPQMGFDVPSIVLEGSIDAAGLRVSGMSVPGLPGIIIGRTPHHAWSMQVGHARTSDYYFEPAPGVTAGYYTPRSETIDVAGQDPVTIEVYRTPNGPVVSPVPFNPATYDVEADGPIVAWKYAHWDKEFNNLKAFLDLPRARSMDEFGEALLGAAVSQHFCYADSDGNIAYWMSGVDPVRPTLNADGQPVDWRLPQGMLASPAHWDADDRKPMPTDRNTAQGFYGGWNNKAGLEHPNAYNNTSYYFGPFHRAHVLDEYLLANDNLTFEEIRDLALYVATTDSFANGGNPWAFVEGDFREAVVNNVTDARVEALAIMEDFDGHFVAGGVANWVDGMDRSDGWVLANAWIQEVLRLTFADEMDGSDEYDNTTGRLRNLPIFFNVLLRALAGDDAAIVNNYDWFQNDPDPGAPQTAETIIVTALDNVLAELDLDNRPWGQGERGVIGFNHPMFDNPPLAMNPLHEMPFSSRSTYAHVVEMADFGQARIESMFPLGQSGTIWADAAGEPVLDPHFTSMTDVFDDFSHREFPVFETDAEGKSKSSSSGCFLRSLR